MIPGPRAVWRSSLVLLLRFYEQLMCDKNPIKFFSLLVIIWSTKLMVRVCFICNITCQDYIDCLVAMALKV